MASTRARNEQHGHDHWIGHHIGPRRRRWRVLLAALGAAPGLLVLASATPVGASSQPADLPSANPANFTPNVENGQVNSIWQVGSRVVIGGTFTSVSNATQNGAALFTRNRVAAFDATTGVVDATFAPNVNGAVNVVVPSPDPGSVYVAGSFTGVNGVTRSRVARISLADGQLVAAFNAGTINGQVRDLRLANGVLYLAGDFSTVNGANRSRLAAVDPNTGALQAQPNLAFAGVHNGGTTNILKIDVTPDGRRLLAIGNFTTINGLDRHQIGLVDLSTNPASVSGWQTNFYTSICASVFNTYMRDLDISPDGRFAVVTTTGAYRTPPSACDTDSRFELTSETGGLQPTWVNYTGGDTSYAVEIQGGVAYVGGHMRWANNPFAGDAAGPGAIPREGIQALDVVNGLPFSWNPGRARGVGVFDFHVTAQGVWAGSDTDTWAGEQRRKLALFPFAGGTDVPADDVGVLPGDVVTLGRVSGAGLDDVQRRSYTGTGAPGSTTVLPGTTDWRNARGAFMVGTTLFTLHADGTVQRRSYDGTTFGAATVTPQFANTMAADLPNVTGLVYDPRDGRIYYTMAGQSALYYRAFTPESSAMGAARTAITGSVAGLQPTRVQGMFLSGSDLYLADATSGNLLRIGLSGGVLSGTATVVDASVDWRGRALFVSTASAPGGNAAPVPAFTASCTGRSCSFDASASTDDGTIVSYAWAFGDGSTGSGVVAARQYAADGTFTVTLTVTDDGGLVRSTSRTVTVAQAVDLPPTAAFTVTCTARTCQFDGRGSSDPENQPLAYAWSFGDGTTGSGSTTSRQYAADGSYTVALTVTDPGGASDTETRSVTVPPPASAIAFRAAASSNTNVTNPTVTVPASIQPGDQLVLIVTVNRATTIATPAGWTSLGQVSDGSPDLASVAFTRTAPAGFAGTTVTVPLGAQSKTSMMLVGYSGAAPITTAVASAEPGNTATHAAPGASIATAGSIAIAYWADKTAGNTGWTVGAPQVERAESLGAGSGQVSAVIAESPALPVGAWPGAPATSSVASAKAVAWTVVVAPA